MRLLISSVGMVGGVGGVAVVCGVGGPAVKGVQVGRQVSLSAPYCATMAVDTPPRAT